jgi:hypothetical protein
MNSAVHYHHSEHLARETTGYEDDGEVDRAASVRMVDRLVHHLEYLARPIPLRKRTLYNTNVYQFTTGTVLF